MNILYTDGRVSCKAASKCFGRHWQYFWGLYWKINQDFSINFKTMWNFLNTAVFWECLECGEVYPCMFSSTSFFLSTLTFQCLLKPSSLVNQSCNRRREINAQQFRVHFYTAEKYCFLEGKMEYIKFLLLRSGEWTQEKNTHLIQDKIFSQLLHVSLAFFLIPHSSDFTLVMNKK